MTQAEIARALNKSEAQISRWKSRPGFPGIAAGPDAIKRWHDEHVLDRGPKWILKVEVDDSLEPLTIESIGYEVPEGSDLKDILDRMKEREQVLFGKLTAAEKYLETHKDVKLASKIPGVQRDYQSAGKAATAIANTIAAMGAGTELERALECSCKYIKLTLDSILYWFGAFPSKFPAGKGREEAFKAMQDIFSKLPNLLENHFAKSGLEDLHKRAFDILEAAKTEAEKQLEKDHAELRKLQGTI
jgi:transcriptional regulator with XRE-family HTH domain